MPAQYCIFDQVLSSNIPLPELGPCCNGKPGLTFELHQHSTPFDDIANWLHQWQDPMGQVILSSVRIAGGHLLRFPTLADFLVGPELTTIECYPENEVSVTTLRHLLLDQVIPRVIGQRGHLVIHASAVSNNHGLVGFVGESGWGKSTLAGAFMRRGYALETDDTLLITDQDDQMVGVPGYRGVRLYDDSAEFLAMAGGQQGSVSCYSDKKRIPIAAVETGAVCGKPVLALFLLNDPSESLSKISVEPLVTATGLIALIKQQFLLDTSGKAFSKNQFGNFSELASSGVKLFTCSYPRNHEMIDELCEKIAGSLS